MSNKPPQTFMFEEEPNNHYSDRASSAIALNEQSKEEQNTKSSNGLADQLREAFPNNTFTIDRIPNSNSFRINIIEIKDYSKKVIHSFWTEKFEDGFVFKPPLPEKETIE